MMGHPRMSWCFPHIELRKRVASFAAGFVIATAFAAVQCVTFNEEPMSKKKAQKPASAPAAKAATLKVGDPCKIVCGSFTGTEGQVEAIRGGYVDVKVEGGERAGQVLQFDDFKVGAK